MIQQTWRRKAFCTSAVGEKWAGSSASLHSATDHRLAAVTKWGCPISRSLPQIGLEIQSSPCRAYKVVTRLRQFEPHTLPWRPSELFAERLCADLRRAHMLQLPQLPQDYRRDNGGATLQPPWKHSRRYILFESNSAGKLGLTLLQVLSQDLEQADPTVFEIIKKVREQPPSLSLGVTINKTFGVGEKQAEALHQPHSF